jgi:hypothetical protein
MSPQPTICKMKPTPLIPIHSAHGFAGHILRTAKGFRAFDSDDREIGSFPNADIAAAALMELATVEAAQTATKPCSGSIHARNCQ